MNCYSCKLFDKNDYIRGYGTCEPQDKDFHVSHECNLKMDEKNKHPFSIICRSCGSDSVAVYATDYDDLSIQCKSCGKAVYCGEYHTDKYDYSG